MFIGWVRPMVAQITTLPTQAGLPVYLETDKLSQKCSHDEKEIVEIAMQHAKKAHSMNLTKRS